MRWSRILDRIQELEWKKLWEDEEAADPAVACECGSLLLRVQPTSASHETRPGKKVRLRRRWANATERVTCDGIFTGKTGLVLVFDRGLG